jgi:hypothetical protein
MRLGTKLREGVGEGGRPWASTTSLLDEPGFEIRRAEERRFALRLWGRLHPGWSGSLSEGLSQSRVSVVSGFARKLGAMRWLSELELEALPGAPDPLLVDYLALASRPLPAGWRTAIDLGRFSIERSPKHGGSLFVEIEGQDDVGFLAALLVRFAFLSLFPEEMRIETRAGVARDRFWLTGIGRSVPSEPNRTALGAILGALVSTR